jgi:hypothetical protein
MTIYQEKILALCHDILKWMDEDNAYPDKNMDRNAVIKFAIMVMSR